MTRRPTSHSDDATQAAPAAGTPLPTTDLGPAPAEDRPLAYSDGTSSMPVIDYQPPRSLRPAWIIALVLLAAGAVAAATFVLGRTTATHQEVTSATAGQQPETSRPSAQPAPSAPRAKQPPAPPRTPQIAQPSAPAPPPASLPAPNAEAHSADDRYWSALIAAGLSSNSRAGSIGQGHTICVSFDDGTSYAELMSRMGTTPQYAAAVIRTAVTVLCPKHGNLLP